MSNIDKVKINNFDIILSPIVSEKSFSEDGKYAVFKVRDTANKTDIKNLVENIFNVKVGKVNIINCKGKKKRFKGTEGVRSSYKKAMIYIKEGEIKNYGEV